MKTRRFWKITLVVIFLAAAFCLVVQPALAGDKSKNKDKNQPTQNAEQKGKKSHDEIDQIIASGPPKVTKSPPGTYIKVRGNSAGMVKYFKNGHPDNNSEWEYCPDGCPYGL